jgi:hypothetical protein
MSASAVVITFLTLGLLAVIVLVVGKPLREAADRRAAGTQEPEASAALGGGPEAERERLEVARETKYREIRDAELDYRTGKLSEEDYRELDAELRAEALTILDSLEAVGPDAGPSTGTEPRPDALPRAGTERRPDPPPRSTPRDA